MGHMHINNLDAGYSDVNIIEDMNVDIPSGQITTIIGGNGCGKSTLLKTIARILPAKGGAITLDGKNISKYPTRELAKRMAILPQSPEGAPGLTVGELVSYGRFPHQTGFGKLSKKDHEVIDWSLEMTGVLAYKYDGIDNLSGGQRQRVWIAMALAQETETILLDEPTTYLDMAHQLEVLELLERLNREEGRTIVMVLHDINQAARFADNIIALKDGKVVKSGNAHFVIQAETLREVFNIEADVVPEPRTGKPICFTYNLSRGENTIEKNNTDDSVGSARRA
ncbi:ABC-type cobalamin Fe3+-siderophores transport system ATPase component [Salimicrobium jeotgali]|uniref:ABC-type cobalamin Fe3+-siderophores transport system ATPase component n=2 Tax=Salimicrobium jeotgali TaxID=1230341 RepID=K2GMI0_9BACI|nr:ABC transporter ATP-binding protein [Salimicrobium jeotgali]EKE31604.1 ABC-type cobalamin Fe3+-siderophores transport system ATPase component [Salimicrobium jeotgali]MBM7696425.1 iron complex transport system ATP-binding protein [Salimicrobium jeotgali]